MAFSGTWIQVQGSAVRQGPPAARQKLPSSEPEAPSVFLPSRHMSAHWRAGPVFEELVQPVSLAGSVNHVVPAMSGPGSRARQYQPVARARHPAVHHKIGYFRVELEPEGGPAGKCLLREILAFRQQHAFFREAETFPDRKSTRLNSSHTDISRMPSSA